MSNKDFVDAYRKHLSQICVPTLGKQNTLLRNHVFMIKSFVKVKQNWCLSRVSEDIPLGAIVFPLFLAHKMFRLGTEWDEENEESLTTLSALKNSSDVIYLHLPRILGWPYTDE